MTAPGWVASDKLADLQVRFPVDIGSPSMLELRGWNIRCD